MVLSKLAVPGRPTTLDNSRARTLMSLLGAGGGCLDIFSFVCLFFILFYLPSSGKRPDID